MIDDIKAQAKLAWDRKQSYANLHEKYQEMLFFSHAGGMWKADRETIAFLAAFKEIEQLTVEDIYNVPRQVSPAKLLELCMQKYQFAANSWSKEYRDLSQIRKAENV